MSVVNYVDWVERVLKAAAKAKSEAGVGRLAGMPGIAKPRGSAGNSVTGGSLPAIPQSWASLRGNRPRAAVGGPPQTARVPYSGGIAVGGTVDPHYFTLPGNDPGLVPGCFRGAAVRRSGFDTRTAQPVEA
jgi:phage-related minor tail protein